MMKVYPQTAEYNAGVWTYSQGYRIERIGPISLAKHQVVGPNGYVQFSGSLTACHAWLTERDKWPTVRN